MVVGFRDGIGACGVIRQFATHNAVFQKRGVGRGARQESVVRSQRAVHQNLYVDLSLGENGAQIQSVNGTFTTTLMAPLLDGTYGLFGDLYDSPNGAVYRGDDAAFVWFIVDNEAPRMAAVDRPQVNMVLSEEDW